MKYTALLVSLALSQCLHAQVKATLTLKYSPQDFGIQKKKIFDSRNLRQNVIPPLVLFGAGLYATTDNDIINRHELKEERDEYIPKFRHHIDDYLQYAPIAAVYGLNAFGVKGKNDFRNRTALLVKSELIMATLTFSLKHITAVPRPDSGQPTSFPSGHTAQAFAAATFMVKEYGDQSIWYSISAYSVAGTIGVFRVMNNRHWISDVLAGAGIGILSTNLAYLTHQYRWQKRKNKSSSTLVLPSYDGKTGMLSMIHRF